MMNLKLQWMLIAFSCVSMIVLIRMVVRNRLELKYSMLWLLLSAMLIVLSLFPGISFALTDWFGFEKPVNFIFFIGVILSMAIIFGLTISLSRLSGKMASLSQELGLLKLELQERRDKEEERL